MTDSMAAGRLDELDVFARDCQSDEVPVDTRLAGRHQYHPPSTRVPTEVTSDGFHGR